jgi:quinol monooxygenase YgiN
LTVILVVSIALRARPHKRPELLSAVDVIVERMRATPACERCRLLVDTEDPNAFTLTSEWKSSSDAEVFFSSRNFQILKGVRMLLKEEPVMLLDELGSRITRLIHAQ